MTEPNYRDLLVRYMALVCHSESVDYLGRAGATDLRPAWFSDEELDILYQISEECSVEEGRMRAIEDESLRDVGQTP